jgi:hypothetical protein
MFGQLCGRPQRYGHSIALRGRNLKKKKEKIFFEEASLEKRIASGRGSMNVSKIIWTLRKAEHLDEYSFAG